MTRTDWKNLETASLIIVLIAILSICIFTSCFALYIVLNVNSNDLAKLLENLKNMSDIVQSFATILAVSLGGLWTLVLFQTRRQKLPRASIEHQVTCRSLPNGKIILPISVFMSNQSEVVLICGAMQTWIQSVIPYDAKAAEALQNWKSYSENNDEKDSFQQWEVIALREHKWEKGKIVIEPGESHQFRFDFLIEPTVKTFRLYTHVQEIGNSTFGWTLASLHDIEMSGNEPKIVNSEFTRLASTKSENKG